MKLVEIKNLFVMDYGASCPLMISDEGNLRLIFYGAEENLEHLEPHNKVNGDQIIELVFRDHGFVSFSPPNDEALSGHPYYGLGLSSGSFYELLDSDLIAKLSTYGRYHHFYNPNAYNKSHHYIIAFKEQLFECVARDFEVYKYVGSIYHQGVTSLNEIYRVNL